MNLQLGILTLTLTYPNIVYELYILEKSILYLYKKNLFCVCIDNITYIQNMYTYMSTESKTNQKKIYRDINQTHMSTH